MPNWCFNETVFYGDAVETKNLYQELNEVLSLIQSPIIDHMDNFLRLLGVPQEEIEKYFLRAHITGFSLNNDGSLLLQYESAWNPIIETLNEVLEKYKPTLKQVTLADECGLGIYVNTDKECLYFPEKYWLDMANENDEYNDTKYHNSLESAIEEFKNFFGIDKEIRTEEELRKEIAILEDKRDCWVSLQEFTPYD